MTINGKKVFQYLIFLGFAVLFLWLANRNLDFDKLLTILKGVHLWPLFLVFFGGFLSHFLRALRWKLLIDPLGYDVNKANTFLSIMVGYAVNLITPRGGEVARCAVLSRYENIPADKLAGTMIAERIIDLISLIVLLVLNYIFEFKYVNEYFAKTIINPLGENLSFIWIAVFIVIIIAAIIGANYFWKKTKDSGNKIVQIIRNIGEGLVSVKNLKGVGKFIFYTICIWVLYWVMTYMGFHAFDALAQTRPGAGLSVLSFGSIGFVIPTPGGAGSYQFFVQEALTNIYGIEKTLAQAYANLSWASQNLILVIGGLFAIIILPIYNRKANQAK